MVNRYWKQMNNPPKPKKLCPSELQSSFPNTRIMIYAYDLRLWFMIMIYDLRFLWFSLSLSLFSQVFQTLGLWFMIFIIYDQKYQRNKAQIKLLLKHKNGSEPAARAGERVARAWTPKSNIKMGQSQSVKLEPQNPT